MTVLLWAFFGIVNALILRTFASRKEKGSFLMTGIVGACGATSGGLVAQTLFQPEVVSISVMSLGILLLEGILLMLIISGKAFTKKAI